MGIGARLDTYSVFSRQKWFSAKSSQRPAVGKLILIDVMTERIPGHRKPLVAPTALFNQPDLTRRYVTDAAIGGICMSGCDPRTPTKTSMLRPCSVV